MEFIAYTRESKHLRGDIQVKNAVLVPKQEIVYLPLEKVQANPYQPRRLFDRSGLDDLANSIREYGVLQPISVRLINGYRYELVAGERRLRASRLAGKDTIPAVVINISDQDSAILALIENLQRQNLHFLEEAEGLQNLIIDYGFTQEELATRVGKNQSTIANKLRVLRLSKNVQKMLVENDLTERHARALLKLPGEQQQIEILKRVIKHELTVRKTEELVEEVLNANKPKQESKKTAIQPYIKDIRILTNSIKENLEWVKKAGVNTKFDLVQTEEGYDIHISLAYPAPVVLQLEESVI